VGQHPVQKQTWSTRPATVEDIAVLLDLRRGMFESMGYQDDSQLSQMVEAGRLYLTKALPAGEFLAWVVEAEGQIVSCGGLVVHRAPPTVHNLSGQEGYVMNMYTRPVWRRQGMAAAVLETILEHLRAAGIPAVRLRASGQGRPLYTRYGFEPAGTEMRLTL
jgi:GNAT superfamily N-acetyltransferase